MRNFRSVYLFLLLPALVLTQSGLMPLTARSEILTINSIKNTALHTLIEGPTSAGTKIKANLILLVGGNGVLKLNKQGRFKKKHKNFLARTRHMFHSKGYLTALVDAPLAKQDKKGLKGFRTKGGHAKDLAKIARRLKARNKRPVIVIGTSRGTISAANLASRAGRNLVSGVVLTSTLLVGKKHLSIKGVAVTKISAPVLIAHHKNDGCRKTPFAAAKKLARKLQTSGIKTSFQAFSGGSNKSKPCKGRSYHGFLGIEKTVIAAITAWIQQQVLSK